MEDLTLPLTISPLSTHVLLLWKTMEAKCLLALKKSTEKKSDQEVEQKKFTALSYPLKKINLPKTNTRDIKDE